MLQARYGFVTGGFAGITVQNSYNSRLQPTLLSAASPSATVFSLGYDFHLGNGDNGNVYQIVNNRDGNRTQNFLYDSLNRIQQAYTNGPNWGETLSPTATSPGVVPATPGIDAWGNLTNRSGVTGKNTYEPLSASATIQNRLTGFGYDAAGNVTSNGSATYTYDAENRVITAGGYTYSYDGDGNRVKKTNGSSGTIYWRDASGEVIDEANLSDTMQNEYVFFGGKRIARRDVPTGHKHYYFSDHLGSASVITSDLGVIQEESDYYPYGGEIPITNGDPNTYKFTGKERDSESGLDSFPARYLTSSMGRWMSPDPLGGIKADPQTLNKYAYVRNNPVTLTDPTGLYTCKDDDNQCKSKQDVAFEKARQQALNSKDADVVRAAKAYGDPTKDGPGGNKVSVAFSADLEKKGEGGTTVSSLGADAQGHLYAQADVTISSKLSGTQLEAAVGHEGSHVGDAQDVVGSISLTNTAPYFKVGMDISHYTSEQRAYAVTDSILRSNNESGHFACGLSDCILGTGLTMRGQLTDTVDRILSNSPNYRSNGAPLSPTNQGGSVVNGLVPQ